MGRNNTISFEINQISACLQYHSLSPINPEQEIKTQLTGEISKIDLDIPFEKTKAQRLLAKTLEKNTSESQINKSKSIDRNSLLTDNEEKVSVSDFYSK